MIRIEGTRSDIYDPTTGEHSVVMDLQVSSSADLPEKDSLVGGAKVAPGSIAQSIQDGTFYTLDDSGTWYDSDGNAAS